MTYKNIWNENVRDNLSGNDMSALFNSLFNPNPQEANITATVDDGDRLPDDAREQAFPKCVEIAATIALTAPRTLTVAKPVFAARA